MGIGQKFVGPERLRMSLVGVEGERQRRAFQDDSHSRMAMAVDAALVALGLAKPPFQLKVVLGKIWIVSTDKEAGREAAHDLRHVLTDRMIVLLQRLLKLFKGGSSPLGLAGGRIERGRYGVDRFDVRPDFFVGRFDLRQPSVDAPGQTPQALFDSPPFSASRFRCSETRTSSRAPAIRNPGGSRGPP